MSKRADPASLPLLEKLVDFNTISANSNLPLIEFVAAYLADHDIDHEIIPSADGRKASLWATIGPKVDGGVVLSGHSDVVPVTGQDWSSDPFKLTLREGRVYGRGSADMKGFIACALAAAPALRKARLNRPIHIALTFDEEIGCIGAPKLLEWLAERSPRPAMAFIGEPTSMQVVNAHKGILVGHTEIAGVEAHSSLAHLGTSAVGLAGRAISLLHAIEQDLAASKRDERFSPSKATISVNRVSGGTAVNILAGHAWFDWDVRSIPAVDAQAVLATFEARLEAEIIGPARSSHPGVRASTTVLADAPALAPEVDGVAEALAKRLLATNETKTVPYAAEAGQFQQAGMSTVIVGPGSIEQAHTVDEFVELDQLGKCEAFITRLGEELGG